MPSSISLGFDDLACFVAVAETGSFTAAAVKLGLRKSTVSRHVLQLETRLGAQLLLRTTRAVRLSAEGRTYLQHARLAVEEADRAAGALRDARSHPGGILRLTTLPYFGDVLLAPLLIEYLGQHPAVSLDLDLRTHPVNLIEEGFDVAIRFGVPKDSDLVCRPIGEARIACVASPDYLRRNGTPQAPADLAAHCIAAMRSDAPTTTWNFQRLSQRVTVTLAPRLRSPSHWLHLEAVIAGFGVARLPEPVVRDALAQGVLQEVLQDWASPVIQITLLMPRRRPLPARTRAFVDHLAAAVASGRFARIMQPPTPAPTARKRAPARRST